MSTNLLTRDDAVWLRAISDDCDLIGAHRSRIRSLAEYAESLPRQYEDGIYRILHKDGGSYIVHVQDNRYTTWVGSDGKPLGSGLLIPDNWTLTRIHEAEPITERFTQEVQARVEDGFHGFEMSISDIKTVLHAAGHPEGDQP